MRKPRKVVPITQGTAKPAPRCGEPQATKEEFRILTCRHTPDNVSFHLGPRVLRCTFNFHPSAPRSSRPARFETVVMW
ncbi:MAG: hypothetical protein ACJ746_13085 [Bryobacteraceae bacterium]